MDARLVYDVGAFDGDDTAHYLGRGFRVIAIEADPGLAGKLSERFASEIRQNRCKVLNIGVAATAGVTQFYVCDAVPLWNSFDPNPAHGHPTRAVPVQCREFGSILADHGVPYFLKVDIEGLDHLCVLALTADDAPAHVSFEAGDESLAAIVHLSAIGYTRFRIVDQRTWTITRAAAPGTLAHLKWSARQVARHGLRKAPAIHGLLKRLADARPAPPRVNGAQKFSNSSSGPMPDELAEWVDLSELLYTWESIKRAGMLASSWFDIHASR